jgi:hypothetical protein
MDCRQIKFSAHALQQVTTKERGLSLPCMNLHWNCGKMIFELEGELYEVRIM